MANVPILLGLSLCAAGGYAQLIYPDEYESMRISTYPTYVSGSSNRGSRLDAPAVYQQYSAPPPNAPTQQFIPAPIGASSLQYSPPPALSAAPNLVQSIAPTQNFYPTAAQPAFPSTAYAATPATNWAEHVNGIISRGIQKFAFDVQREFYKDPRRLQENIIFSPLNIAVALAMVLLGSAGRTFDEVSKVLGLHAGVDISRHSEVVHQMFGILLNQVEDNLVGSPGPKINSASGIFVQTGYPIRPEFKAVSESAYHSEVINLDFYNQPREAQIVINNWVRQKTNDKITSILEQEPERSTAVMLVSALYFNGEWNQHFMRGATKMRQFSIEPNRAINVDMMYNAGAFQFYEDKNLGAKIVRLPYKGQDIAMYILLPSTPGARALRDFQSQLTPEILESLINNMKNETCIIGLPRMKLSSTLNLEETLRSLGLESLFNPATADLSLLSPGYSRPVMSPTQTPPQTTSPARDRVLTASPILPGSAIAKSNRPPVSQLSADNDVIVFPRFGDYDGTDNPRRHFFSYEDKVRGLSIQQWATGFSISRSGRTRRQTAFDGKPSKKAAPNSRRLPTNSYNAGSSHSELSEPEIVRLEENKYQFESKNVRGKRQNRPMNEDFLNYIRSLNLPSYGLDELRNSANLVNPGLYASRVLHKVEIEVTETGTEAASATAVILERDGNQKRLVANRPFVFFIRHDSTKFVLFWGTVNTPTPNYPVT